MSEHTLDEIKGLGPATKTKLHGLNIHTVEALAFTTSRDLEEAGIKDAAPKLIQQAIEFLAERSFISARELLEQRKSVTKLSTGSKQLDELYQGGYETQSITEYASPYGCGKTQLCLTAAVMAQQPKEQGGLNGGVLWIDSEETFRPERVYQIAEARGFDPEKVVKGIMLAPAYNSEHQTLIAQRADEVMKQNKIRLIVVDSVLAHFRSEYLGRDQLPPRQGKLNQHLHQIMKLARAFNAVPIVTNQATANPTGNLYAPEWKATGGNIIAHTCNLRVLLRPAGKNTRIASVADSSWIEPGERVFKITAKGIEDVPEDEKKKSE